MHLVPPHRQMHIPHRCEIALKRINFDLIHRHRSLLTPTSALTAQVNCACAFVAGACLRNRLGNFILKFP